MARQADVRSAADEAYRHVLAVTGDRGRAERVRAHMLGAYAPVSPLTARAARTGRLPSSSIADTGTRATLTEAGVPVKVPAGGLIGQGGRDILRSVVDAPAGYAELARVAATGDPIEVRRLAAGLAHQVGEDVRHPLRHPGYTLLDALTVLSLGGAGALRAPRALRRVKATPRTVKAIPRQARLAVRDFKEDLRGPDPIQKRTREVIRQTQVERLGEKAVKAAERRARWRAKQRNLPTALRAVQYGPLGPLAYPPAKAVRLARAEPSLKRSVDTAALTTSTDATLRRVRSAVARRNAIRAAEQIKSYR